MAHETQSSTHERVIQALPPLPAVALRVIQVAQDPRSSAGDLALVMSSDPGLSARILRVVNSAAFRRSREITSVQEGLVMLGFIQARNIAISSAITSAYSKKRADSPFRIDAFWRHSIAVAYRASDLAAAARKIDPASAFTAGIVHDMGRLALFHADPAGVERAVEYAIAEGVSLEQAEQQMLEYDHATAGGLLARRWNLPPDVCEAIARHHVEPGGVASLSDAVASADSYCIANGVLPGYVRPENDAEQAEPANEFMRLTRRVDNLMELVSGPGRGMMAA